jgi:uncharacterized protein (DUF1800 family)
MTKRIVPVFLVLALTVIGGRSVLPAAAPATPLQAAHLLNRSAFGPRPGDVEAVVKSGIPAYLDSQLHPEQIDDSAINGRMAALEFPASGTSGAALQNARRQNDPRPILEQIQAQKLMRAIYSKRQLQEVMVDFWFNHFNVSWAKEGMTNLVKKYENESIRPQVFGKFKELLLATAKSPAMLVYLDNAWSATPDVNENYARELMELHTMGVDGGYTQKDVVEVARCFTGWTIDKSNPENSFVFDSKMHDNGDKVVLGHTIHAGGIAEGEAVIDILAHQPATARFIATKLARRFVADDPPASLVNRAAKVFTDTDGDLREVVRTILMSEEFSNTAAFGQKVKSPFEMVVSTMRAIEADIQPAVEQRQVVATMRALPPGSTELTKAGGAGVRVSPAVIITQAIEQMGQYLYRFPDPNGLPDRASYWMGGWELMHRLDFEEGLLRNEILGTTVDVQRLISRFKGDPLAPDAWMNALSVLQGTGSGSPPLPEVGSKSAPTAWSAERILALAATAASTKDSAELRAFVLALGSPEFQHK